MDGVTSVQPAAAEYGPGLYPGIEHHDYLKIPAASASRLSFLKKKSPAHLRYELDHPTTSDAMRLGSAIHCLLLEPDRFESDFVQRPKFDLRKTADKLALEQFEAEHKDRTILSLDDYQTAQICAAALFRHEDVATIVAQADSYELTGIWTDFETGLNCKLRADIVCPSLSMLADLKSTRDASPDAFMRSILNFGYHRQAAWYLEGIAALGQPTESFVFIAFEKEPPYGVAVYRLEDEALEIGRRENRDLLRRYAECVIHDYWPSYPTGIQSITLPPWILRQEGY